MTCFVGERRCVGGADPRLSRHFSIAGAFSALPVRPVKRTTLDLERCPCFLVSRSLNIRPSQVQFCSAGSEAPWDAAEERHLDFGPGSKRDQSRPWPRRTGPCTHRRVTARLKAICSIFDAAVLSWGDKRHHGTGSRCAEVPARNDRGAYWLVSVGCRCHARKPAHAVMSRALSGTALGTWTTKWARIRRPTRSGRTGELTDSAAESRWAGKHQPSHSERPRSGGHGGSRIPAL